MVFSPGQDLEELVSRMSLDRLSEIVGDDIVKTVTVLSPPGGLASALRLIAQRFFSLRPEEMFGNSRIRKICYDAMTSEKLSELAERLGFEDWRQVETLNPFDDTNVWNRYIGFFGIDARGAAQVYVDPAEANVEPMAGLFVHQRRAVDRIWNALEGGFGRVVLHMPTGAGKTRTAMHVVSRFLNMQEPCVVVWLAASAELLDQGAEAFEHTWSTLGDRSVTLMRFWGDHAPAVADIQDGLVVAGLQKANAFFARRATWPIALGGKSEARRRR